MLGAMGNLYYDIGSPCSFILLGCIRLSVLLSDPLNKHPPSLFFGGLLGYFSSERLEGGSDRLT